METGIIHLHSILRYIIILAAIWAIVSLINARNARKTVTKKERTPATLLTILVDIQFLLGIILFIVKKYFTRITEVGISEWDRYTKFFVFEHVPLMFIALILLHIGSGALKKSDRSDHRKYGKAITMFIIGLIIILLAIPWPFRGLGHGWMAGM